MLRRDPQRRRKKDAIPHDAQAPAGHAPLSDGAPGHPGAEPITVQHLTPPRRDAGVAVLIVVTVGLMFQLGSAIAVHVMDSVGVIQTLWMRTAFAAMMLIAVRSRSLRMPPRGQRAGLAGLTMALLGMNLLFYAAIHRVPLGIVVTIEFLGPLTVAVIGSRRLLDWLWIALAGAGVAVLAGPGGSADPLGLLFAFGAAGCWGAFILLGKRAITHMPPLSVTTLMLTGSALIITPVLLATGVQVEGKGTYLLLGLLIALLSSALPYHLEFLALRRVTSAAYGVLLSIEPALAALVGFVVLGQELAAHEILAIFAVAAAAAGTSWTHGR